MLCLQLNRIEYKDQELIKNRNKCAIEKTLYIDRFMYDNRVKSMQLQKHVKELREQIRHLELSIEKFTNFNNSEYDILKVFEQSIKFFSEQGKIDDDWQPASNVKSYHPLKDQIPGGDQANVKTTLAMLNKFHG